MFFHFLTVRNNAAQNICAQVFVGHLSLFCRVHTGFPGGTTDKEPACQCRRCRTCLPMQEMQETELPSLGQEDTLEKEMATHSYILAWRILQTEKPGGLQSTGSQRVGHG